MGTSMMRAGSVPAEPNRFLATSSASFSYSPTVYFLQHSNGEELSEPDTSSWHKHMSAQLCSYLLGLLPKHSGQTARDSLRAVCEGVDALKCGPVWLLQHLIDRNM